MCIYQLGGHCLLTSSSSYVKFPYCCWALLFTSSENFLYSTLSGFRNVTVIRAWYALLANILRSSVSFGLCHGVSDWFLLQVKDIHFLTTYYKSQKCVTSRQCLDFIWGEKEVELGRGYDTIYKCISGMLEGDLVPYLQAVTGMKFCALCERLYLVWLCDILCMYPK